MNGCGRPLDHGGVCGGTVAPDSTIRAFHGHCITPIDITVNVDFGALQWDIRLALKIKAELARGWCWQRKDGGGTYQSFSESLLDAAGGIRRLLAEWEPEPGSPLALEAAKP